MKRIIIPVLILGLCFSLSAFLMRNPKRLSETPMEIIPVAVRVIDVTSSSAKLVVGSQGKVQAAQTANLAAATPAGVR